MNSTANPPLNDDVGDGARLVEGPGDSFKVIEADGTTSVMIQSSPRDADKPFRVRYFRSSQEIIDADGKFVARTMDPEVAKHICNLLIVYKNMQDRKAGT